MISTLGGAASLRQAPSTKQVVPLTALCSEAWAPLRFGAEKKPALEELAGEMSGTQPLTGKTTQDVNNFALKLFRNFGNQADLLRFLRMAGVKVITGQEQSWIDKSLRHLNAGAALITPRRWWFPEQPSKVTAKELPEDPSPELLQIYQEANEQRQLIMLLPSTAPLGSLLHETYHVIQAKMGVHKPLKNQDVQSEAQTAFFDLARSLKGNIVTQSWKFRRLEQASKKLKAEKEQGLITPDPNGVGQALRIRAYREMDVYHFLRDYGEELGLGFWDMVRNSSALSLYPIIENYSYKFDPRTESNVRTG